MKNFGSPKGPIFNKSNHIGREAHLVNNLEESLRSNV